MYHDDCNLACPSKEVFLEVVSQSGPWRFNLNVCRERDGGGKAGDKLS